MTAYAKCVLRVCHRYDEIMGQRRVKPGQCCVKAGKAGLAGNGCHETKTRVKSTVARCDSPRSNDSTIQDKAVAALRGHKRRRRPFRRPGQGRRGMYPGLTQVTRGMLMTGCSGTCWKRRTTDTAAPGRGRADTGGPHRSGSRGRRYEHGIAGRLPTIQPCAR